MKIKPLKGIRRNTLSKRLKFKASKVFAEDLLEDILKYGDGIN
jgi:hypothetical protein